MGFEVRPGVDEAVTRYNVVKGIQDGTHAYERATLRASGARMGVFEAEESRNMVGEIVGNQQQDVGAVLGETPEAGKK